MRIKPSELNTIRSTETLKSLHHAASHYENFPVASILMPRNLREPIALIYSFARQADDIADEGDISIEARLNALENFRDELNLIQAYIKPQTPFFSVLGEMIRTRNLPFAPFYNLLDAFSQDVTKTRYQNVQEVLDYCTRSANPIGRLLLHLYQAATPHNLYLSDQICTALQMINFLQDIAIDFRKNDDKQRIYLCQDELSAFGISEKDVANYVNASALPDVEWQHYMQFNLQRVQAILNAGKPLGYILKGRIGIEMRMIIAGGERIIAKIHAVNGDVFMHRPVLTYRDWAVIVCKALFRI